MYYDSYAFGRRICKARESCGKTQKELSMELNIARNTLSYIENGRRTPSIDLLVDIAAILNVSLDYLLLGNENSTFFAIGTETRSAMRHLENIQKLAKQSSSEITTK